MLTKNLKNQKLSKRRRKERVERRIKTRMRPNDLPIHFSSFVKNRGKSWWNNWIQSWNPAKQNRQNKNWQDSWQLNGNHYQYLTNRWVNILFYKRLCFLNVSRLAFIAKSLPFPFDSWATWMYVMFFNFWNVNGLSSVCFKIYDHSPVYNWCMLRFKKT